MTRISKRGRGQAPADDGGDDPAGAAAVEAGHEGVCGGGRLRGCQRGLSAIAPQWHRAHNVPGCTAHAEEPGGQRQPFRPPEGLKQSWRCSGRHEQAPDPRRVRPLRRRIGRRALACRLPHRLGRGGGRGPGAGVLLPVGAPMDTGAADGASAGLRPPGAGEPGPRCQRAEPPPFVRARRRNRAHGGASRRRRRPAVRAGRGGQRTWNVRSASSPRGSGRSWCCATSRTCPRHRWPSSWAVRSARSRARRPVPSSGYAETPGCEATRTSWRTGSTATPRDRRNARARVTRVKGESRNDNGTGERRARGHGGTGGRAAERSASHECVPSTTGRVRAGCRPPRPFWPAPPRQGRRWRSCVTGGAPAAYAGWSATPTSASTPSPQAAASCQDQLTSSQAGPHGQLGSGAWQNVLTDVRGPFTVALFQDDGAYAACFTSSSFTEVNQIASSGGAGVSGSTGWRRSAGSSHRPAAPARAWPVQYAP